MSFTVNDALSQVAGRMGYDGVPNDTTEKARWIMQCDDAQRSIIRKNLYWFTQTIKSLPTESGVERYDLESDFREMIDVRINGLRIEPITQHEQSVRYNNSIVGIPISPSSSRYRASYFLYGERELHIVPAPSAPPASQSVSGITRSGSTVTVTTTAEHGYNVDEFVTISGADQTDYNQTVRIHAVPSTTTFTFIFTAGETPTTPATGTILVIKRDLVYQYYKMPARLDALTDTLLIPDLFFEGFVAYVKARIDLRDSERGSASDGFDEFNTIIEDLDVENNKRLWANVNILSY